MISIHSKVVMLLARLGYVHTSAQSVQAAACCTNLFRVPLVRMQWRPSAARLEARAILRFDEPTRTPRRCARARARAHVGALLMQAAVRAPTSMCSTIIPPCVESSVLVAWLAGEGRQRHAEV